MCLYTLKIMFGYLIILFTVLPAIELAVLINVGSHIGAGNTILLIILTGVAGAYLARLQGFIVFEKIQTQLSSGKMPSEEMIDGLMIFCGGVLLLTPGFITDALGFLLLIPITRNLIKKVIRKKFNKTIYREDPSSKRHLHSNHFYDDYEDADFDE